MDGTEEESLEGLNGWNEENDDEKEEMKNWIEEDMENGGWGVSVIGGGNEELEEGKKVKVGDGRGGGKEEIKLSSACPFLSFSDGTASISFRGIQMPAPHSPLPASSQLKSDTTVCCLTNSILFLVKKRTEKRSERTPQNSFKGVSFPILMAKLFCQVKMLVLIRDKKLWDEYGTRF